MAKNKSEVTARVDPDPQHFLLARLEFDRLCEVARVPEREHCLFLLGLAIPSGVNAIGAWPTGDQLTTSFILNFIVVIVTVLLAVFQGTGWLRKRKAYEKLVKSIQDRPPTKLTFVTETSAFVPAPDGAGAP